MNTQDLVHQAQDVLDRLVHRSAPLLPVLTECRHDSAMSGSSVLTNVAPPSALPSFLTSPRPPAAPPTLPPPGTTVSQGITAPPIPPTPSGTFAASNFTAGQTFSPPSLPASHPVDPSVPAFSSCTTASAYPSVPTLKTDTSQSHGLFTRPPAPPGISVLEMTVPTSGGVSSPGGAASSGVSAPSKASSFPPLPPSNNHPTPPPASRPAEPGLVPQSSPPSPQEHYMMEPNSAAAPVTSQMQLLNSESSANASASVDNGSPSVAGPARGADGRRGWFGWIRGTVSSVGHRVAERAKTSMDSMITTLDPQMKEFIHSGGDMDIIVASDKEVKVGAIREAFQMTFGKATVCGMKAEAPDAAAQPVGFEAALNSAEGRINSLRSSGQVHPQQPVVAVENFIVEFHSDCWFDIGLLLLDDPGEDIILQTYTQVTPVPPDFVNQARLATPADYPFKDFGFAVTVGQIASQALQVHHTMWQESLTGVSRREALVLAGRTLAGLYRSRLPDYH